MNALALYLAKPVDEFSMLTTVDRQALAAALRCGNVLLSAGNTRCAELVKRLTRSTWSHVSMYVGPLDDGPDPLCIVEAHIKDGVRAIRLSDLDARRISVLRPVRLGDTERARLAESVLRHIGSEYDLAHAWLLARSLFVRLSFPKTRRARADRTGAPSRITPLIVRNGYAGHRVPEMRPPCPGLADAPSAGWVRPSLGRGAFSSCDTSHHRNTHITESLEVRYPWHPWHGQRVWIYERFVKGGVASFRCGLGEFAGDRSMDLPQWMLDPVACCDLRLTLTPVVSCEALAALKVLIVRRGEAQTVAFVEARHLDPSPLGDADAKLAEDYPICALSPAEPVPKLGQSACADQTAVDTTSGPIDARASHKGNRRKTVRGGRS